MRVATFSGNSFTDFNPIVMDPESQIPQQLTPAPEKAGTWSKLPRGISSLLVTRQIETIRIPVTTRPPLSIERSSSKVHRTDTGFPVICLAPLQLQATPRE